MSIAKARRFDFYPDDWIAGTATLDVIERGIYITAIAAMGSHGGPILKAELRHLCPIHGNAYNRAIKTLVGLGKLIEKGAHFTNKRSEKELKKANKRVEIAAKNGRKGGRPRIKNNGLEKATENQPVIGAEKLPSPSPSPILEFSTAEPESPTPGDGEASEKIVFDGETFKLSETDMAACREVYKFSAAALWDRLVTYDDKWKAAGQRGTLKRVLGFLRVDCERGVANGDWSREEREESLRLARLHSFEKTGRWDAERWGPHPGNGAAA